MINEGKRQMKMTKEIDKQVIKNVVREICLNKTILENKTGGIITSPWVLKGSKYNDCHFR